MPVGVPWHGVTLQQVMMQVGIDPGLLRRQNARGRGNYDEEVLISCP